MKTHSTRFTTSQRQKGEEQGSILFMTIFVLLVLALVATGFMALLPTEMRSARHDRAVVQGSFATDAAVQYAMNQLAQTGGNIAGIPLGKNNNPAARVAMGHGWSYELFDLQDLGNQEVRVTTRALANNREMRRAVAIIDNGAPPDQNPAVRLPPRDPNNPGNAEFHWPATVPIKGNVLTSYLWRVNNSGVDPLVPPFDGTIYHVYSNSSDSKGYHTNALVTESDYSRFYTQGIDAIQPHPEEFRDVLTSTEQRSVVLTELLGLDPDGGQNPDTVLSSYGVGTHVPNNNGTMEGGIYINRAGQGQGNQPGNVAIRFYLDSNGNSVMWVGDSDASVGAGQSAGGGGGKNGGGGGGGSTTVQGQEFVFVTQDASGNDLPPNQHQLIVRNVESTGVPELTLGSHNGVNNVPLHASSDPNVPATPTGQISNTPTVVGTAQTFNGDFTDNTPIYVNGGIGSIQGVIKGNKTVGAATGVVITGEVLKSDVPRGVEATTASNDVLGLIGGLNTNSPNTGMAFNIQGPVPSDDILNMYFHVMMTPMTNGQPTMMFNNPQQNQNTNPSAAGARINLFGSFHVGQQAPGHANHLMNFIFNNFAVVIVDENTPLGFEIDANTRYTPRLRSYLEIPAGERRLD